MANAQDVKFAKEMIKHHEMALVMAQKQIDDGEDGDMKRLAMVIKVTQQTEIKRMETWLDKNEDDVKSSGGKKSSGKSGMKM